MCTRFFFPLVRFVSLVVSTSRHTNTYSGGTKKELKNTNYMHKYIFFYSGWEIMNKIGARSFHSFEAVGNLNSSASDLEGKKKTMKTAENRTLEMMQMMPLISIYFF